MKDHSQRLLREYVSSLREFHDGQGEAALRRAYEAGRRALADGLGVLDMVAAHRSSVIQELDLRSIEPESVNRVYKEALSCFAESLSPFEMALRGAQESNARLQDSLVD